MKDKPIIDKMPPKDCPEKELDHKCWHTCPFKEEINNDYDTLCDCDVRQTRECAMDI